ncbi:hypothetical protein [Collinsella tanakaei]|uniref:hypothetical protein n=1 Tax=Collinsella tanakaei TaxID=626935 RepID=UPI001F40292B|nr:hypothetical protein [Collinsella tanakaei]MCF2621173.1 hypothetical protein [Collinsella tanakaei]
MDTFYQVITMLTFGFVIALYVWMPTKRDLRRLAAREGALSSGLREQLKRRRGTSCKLMLDEANPAVGSAVLDGTVVDVDDEWVLVERPFKQGDGTQFVAVRLEGISSIEE